MDDIRPLCLTFDLRRVNCRELDLCMHRLCVHFFSLTSFIILLLPSCAFKIKDICQDYLKTHRPTVIPSQHPSARLLAATLNTMVR